VADDPFADLGLDRTVIMPVPGGRAAPARPAPAAQPPSPSEQAEVADATAVTSGLNPLIAAANRLLNVLPQLRSTLQHPNPAALRDSLARDIRQFEAQARTAGAPTEKIVAARYALCTLIDETATSTPLGASGAWSQQGLLALFHGETEGGEKFFQLLSRLAENPQANVDLLELMYVCLEFGLEGRYRVIAGGQRQLEAIRQRLLQIIRKQRGEYERDLSPSWRGVPAAAQRRLGWLPLWVVAAVTAVALVGIYVGFDWSLGRA
jgi:type VI secretion system protein ImpK